MKLEHVSVILVEPQGALNIGAVCRAMMNFGLADLRMVNPQADFLGDEARRMAVKAGALLEGARLFATLEEAVADCQLVIGTTRRFGKYREDFLHPEEAAELLLPWTDQGRAALLFGREDRGLLTTELDLCQRLLTIPTHDELPSMNLAQSVAVCLYEVSRAFNRAQGVRSGGKRFASGKVLEGMFQHMRRTLLSIDFLDPQNPEHILRTFRRIFGRSGLNDREVRILHGLWSRIDWLDGELRSKGARQVRNPADSDR
jgi:tRNA/rRNA methyltransferase